MTYVQLIVAVNGNPDGERTFYGPFQTLQACQSQGTLVSRAARERNLVIADMACVVESNAVHFNFNADGSWSQSD